MPGAYPAQQNPYTAQTPASSSLPYGQQQQNAYPAAQTASTGRAGGAYPQQALTPQQQTYGVSTPAASQQAAAAAVNPYAPSNSAAYGFAGWFGKGVSQFRSFF